MGTKVEALWADYSDLVTELGHHGPMVWNRGIIPKWSFFFVKWGEPQVIH